MSRYTAGRAVEYQARDELVAQGYTVIRVAGSKGPIDLVAVDDRAVLFIQVKSSKKHVPNPIVKEALIDLAMVARPAAVKCQVWVKTPGAKFKIHRLTAMNGKLWSAETV